MANYRQEFEDMCNDEKFQVMLRNFLLFRCDNNFQDATAIAQNTLEEAWRQIDLFRGDCSLQTWVLSVGRVQTLEFLKRRKRDKAWQDYDRGDVGFAAIADFLIMQGAAMRPDGRKDSPHQSTLDVVESREKSKIFNDVLNSMPSNYRRAILRRCRDGAGIDTLAEEEGLTYKGAESLISRAKETFQMAWNNYYKDDDHDNSSVLRRLQRISTKSR